MNKAIPMLGILLTACLISGCHQNPLKTNSLRKSSRFLINASVAAEKSLHLGLHESQSPWIYGSCMEGKAKTDCATFYQAMLEFAKSGAFPEFKGVNLADLKDKAVFETLQDEYESRCFMHNLGR